MSILETNFKNENVPVDVESNSTPTTININDNKYPAIIKLDVNKAVEIADAILNSIGELNSDEFNDKIYELENKIKELENKIKELEAALQDREDRIDYMHRHETYMPF